MNRAILLGMTAALCVAPIAAFAQSAGGAAAYKAPRDSLGRPDITGTWSNASLTPQTRNPAYGLRSTFSAEEIRILEEGLAEQNANDAKAIDINAKEGASDNVGAYDRAWIDGGSTVMRVRGEPRNSILTTPDGMIPVRKGSPPRTLMTGAGTVEAGLAAARRSASADQIAGQGNVSASAAGRRTGAFDNPEARGAGERCLTSFGRNAGPPMFANGWYNNNYQIAQSRDAVAITVEMVHDTRVVRLNSKHRTDGVRPWFGDSIGWYEGDSLVVETTNIPQRLAYGGSWENLKVTERFTRVGKDRLHYAFTVEDNTTWDKPFGGEYEFRPTNGTIMEYACHEGNYALEGILAGAREEERNAAKEGRPIAAAQ